MTEETPQPVRFDATVLDPDSVSDEMQSHFEQQVLTADASDLRIGRDEQGCVTVSFLVAARSIQEALAKGSDITLSALDPFPSMRWISAGATFWYRT